MTPSTGTFTGAAGTSLNLYDEVLAPSSVISSAGTVGLNLCTEAGSYSAAGGTIADDSTFTGPVLDLGTRWMSRTLMARASRSASRRRWAGR